MQRCPTVLHTHHTAHSTGKIKTVPLHTTGKVKVVPSHTTGNVKGSHWSLGWSQSLGSHIGGSYIGDINHKATGKLPLLSTRPAVTFPAMQHYQIILLDDRDTGVNNLPKVIAHRHPAGSRTLNLLITCLTLYWLCHHTTIYLTGSLFYS